MAISVGSGRRRGFRDINVTPLVDVMLVLLVVFMVTAPLLTTGLRIDLPEVKAASTPIKDARLLISITKQERVLFGEEDVTANVDEALKNSARVQKERELYIRADNVKGAIVTAGMTAAKTLTTSRGELDASGSDEASWSKDRRVDIVLGQ